MQNSLVQFVVLRHCRKGSQTHYDLMIELDGSQGELATYSLPIPPEQLITTGKSVCKRIFDHDRKFLTYEGKVNGGQGSVEKVDQGGALIITKTPLKCEFKGNILSGCFDVSGESLTKSIIDKI